MRLKMETKNHSMLTNEREAIVALCTAQGSGAIAMLRLSGDNAIAVADEIAQLSSQRKLVDQPSHTIHHGYLVDRHQQPEELVDEVLFLLMKAPRTFTGQDTVEINCHNNPFIINRIIACAIRAGARQAKPGEFTKRAYLNEKIDLLQAESIRDLIHASSEEGLKAALAQSKGSLSAHIKLLEQEVVMLLTLAEASFEFLEEEQQDIAFHKTILDKITVIQTMVADLKNRFNDQQVIRDGVRIALIGHVNAGKSTLFNKLANKDRAIVSEMAGTTRDSIEYSIVQDGIFWQLIDTAGLRTTNDHIEQLGIERSLDEAVRADIILMVIDGSRTLSEEEMQFYGKLLSSHEKKIITVITKRDLVDQCQNHSTQLAAMNITNPIYVSAHTNVGISALLESIHATISVFFQQHRSPYLLNQRHVAILTEVQNKLQFIALNFLESLEYELVAYHLRTLLEHLAEMTGKQTSEEILNTVFSTFCIGK